MKITFFTKLLELQWLLPDFRARRVQKAINDRYEGNVPDDLYWSWRLAKDKDFKGLKSDKDIAIWKTYLSHIGYFASENMRRHMTFKIAPFMMLLLAAAFVGSTVISLFAKDGVGASISATILVFAITALLVRTIKAIRAYFSDYSYKNAGEKSTVSEAKAEKYGTIPAIIRVIVGSVFYGSIATAVYSVAAMLTPLLSLVQVIDALKDRPFIFLEGNFSAAGIAAVLIMIGLYALSLLISSGVFGVGVRMLLPRVLIDSEEDKAVQDLIDRNLLADRYENTPADLRDRFRIPKIDKNNMPVKGQVLIMDVEFSPFNLYIDAYLGLYSLAALTSLLFVTGIPVLQVIAIVIILRGFQSLNEESALKVRSKMTIAAASTDQMQGVINAVSPGVFKMIEEAKTVQIERASNDDSIFIKLGKSTGISFARKDPFAPSEAGMDFGLSVNDLSTHMLILGKSGSGKTAGVSRPLALTISKALRENKGQKLGGIILDGKGLLGRQLYGIFPDYQLLSPENHKFNLIHNLTAPDVGDVFFDRFGSESGESSEWHQGAAIMISHAASVVLASEKGTDKQKWNLVSVYNMLFDEAKRKQVLNATPPSLDLSDTERAAMMYWAKEFPAMPEKARGSLLKIVGTWFSSLMNRDGLREWLDCDGPGVEVEAVCQGAWIGMDLPEHKYGRAGALIQEFAMRRLVRRTKQRGEDLTYPETPYLMFVEECQLLLTKDIAVDWISIARGLGCYMYMSTQSPDALEDVVSEVGMRQMNANIDHMIAFWSRTELADHMISKRMGNTYLSGVDFWDDTHRYFNNAADAYSQTALQKFGKRMSSRLTTEDAEIANLATSLDAESTAISNKQNFDPESCTRRIYSPNEIQNLLSKKFVAMASIHRGGVPRRDIIELDPIFTIETEETATETQDEA